MTCTTRTLIVWFAAAAAAVAIPGPAIADDREIRPPRRPARLVWEDYCGPTVLDDTCLELAAACADERGFGISIENDDGTVTFSCYVP